MADPWAVTAGWTVSGGGPLTAFRSPLRFGKRSILLHLEMAISLNNLTLIPSAGLVLT